MENFCMLVLSKTSIVFIFKFSLQFYYWFFAIAIALCSVLSKGKAPLYCTNKLESGSFNT